VLYWQFGTKSVSPTIVEIMGPKYIGVMTLTFLGSRDVISHVTIRIPMGHFLLVVHWTQVSICCWCRHWLLMTDSNAELIQKVVHSLKDSCKYIIVTQTKCVIWLSIWFHGPTENLSLISLLVSIRTKYWLLMVGGCSRTSLSSASSISCRA